MSKIMSKPQLSVVIATLGGVSIKKTLDLLNSGSLVPDEVIISIPRECLKSIPKSNHKNLIINECEFRGQVKQRAEGFKIARGQFVIQIDDDVSVDYNCLKRLFETMSSLNGQFAVAPAFFSNTTGLSVFKKNTEGVFSKLYYFLMNGKRGYQPGKFYLSGTGDGVEPNSLSEKIIETEWLSGGCIIHRKVDLIKENYFPFSGKAYCEDFIHSFLMTQKGTKLFVDPAAKVFIDLELYSSLSIGNFFKFIIADFRARKYFMALSKRKSLRIYIFFCLMIFNYLSTKMITQFK